MSNISGSVKTTVIVGSSQYPSPLTIDNTGSVAPVTYGATGVYENGGSYSVTVYGQITGGYGEKTVGGIGVDLVAGTLTNEVGGSITGGSGVYGNPYKQNIGGIGVWLSGGALANYGSISGGAGHVGGTGVDLLAGVLTNTGTISGGDGNPGTRYVNAGLGGVGIQMYGGTLINSGTIMGGSAGRPYDNYPDGGTGVNSFGGSLTNSGVIIGGAGSYSASGGDGVAWSSGTLTNGATGSITGGSGSGGGGSGEGGVGVSLGGGVLNNYGHITGGDYGLGDAGVFMSAGALNNFGTITGNGGAAGVLWDGGTLINAGTISGGVNAIKFGTAASTLVVDPGAIFVGKVDANVTVNDVLQLTGTQSGGSSIAFGSQFINFSTLDFASGAAWRVEVSTGAALSSGLTINGFTQGDAIDFTNLTANQLMADINPATYVITTSDGVLNFNGLSGDQFLLSNDGSGGTAIVLAHNPITTTLTLGSGVYPSSVTITTTGAVAPTADGATGVVSNLAGNSLTNFGSIQGGGSISGVGGIGVNFSATGTLINNGNITGGNGGGSGGVGVELSAGSLTNNASIIGGSGGTSAVGGAGVLVLGGVLSNTANITGGDGSAGGAGVNMNSGALTNTGTISGGVGAAGGVGGRGVGLYGGTLVNNGTIEGGTGGAKAKGAAGVYQYGGTMTNYGNIIGGSGGTNARGAAGVFSKSGTLTNIGTITGGSGSGTGRGWAGVYLNGGTAVTSGTISGGAGGSSSGVAGAAAQFGAVASTLVIDPGAIFNGQVLANAAVNDTLELAGTQSGGTAITLGAQFTGFSTLDFASGAAWKVNVGAGAASTTGLAINGFVLGDTMDVTNFTPAQVAADFNPTTNVLSTTSDGTLSFVGPFTNEYFLFSSDAIGGTSITLVQGAGISTPLTSTVALGSKGYLSPLTITSTGNVAPTSAGATAVNCSMAGKSLTNNGTVQAAAGSGGNTGNSGGVGVNFKAADILINHSAIAGGTGGIGTTNGGHGGAGVYSAGGTLTNDGGITGGNGGASSSKGGLGGAGVFSREAYSQTAAASLAVTAVRAAVLVVRRVPACS